MEVEQYLMSDCLSSSLAIASSQQPILEVRNISVAFREQNVLKNISLQVFPGQTIAIIGESGCGKTVLLKTIIGLIKPASGEVVFKGHNVCSAKQHEVAELRRRIGFVFQNAALFDSLTIFDNVAFPMQQRGPISHDLLKKHVIERLLEVGLPSEVGDKYPAELSGGMRKRVGLARALILQPELIIYDEPTTGLDPIMSDVINELILATRRNHPVTSVLVTHDMRSARKVANRVIMLYPSRRLATGESQILFDGRPSELDHSEDPRVRQFIRGEAGQRVDEPTKHVSFVD